MTIIPPSSSGMDANFIAQFVDGNPGAIIGCFWSVCGEGFSEETMPVSWINIGLEENPAQVIIDLIEKGVFNKDYGKSQEIGNYLSLLIFVIAEKGSFANFSYIIRHFTMFELSAYKQILMSLAKYKTPIVTEFEYPKIFLKDRFPPDHYLVENKDLTKWSVQVWEDYCSYLMANQGHKIVKNHWNLTV